jgi:hypothetical protein
LVTHSPVFADTIDSLDADNWLCTSESKFGMLHYTEF